MKYGKINYSYMGCLSLVPEEKAGYQQTDTKFSLDFHYICFYLVKGTVCLKQSLLLYKIFMISDSEKHSFVCLFFIPTRKLIVKLPLWQCHRHLRYSLCLRYHPLSSVCCRLLMYCRYRMYYWYLAWWCFVRCYYLYQYCT